MTGLSLVSVGGNHIQKGQTLNSGELSQFTNHWYVTAGDGDVVVRVFPGMWLGETENGELSLDGSDAQLSLSIGSDELLAVFAVNGGELDSEAGEFCGRRHLAFDSAATIRLPNNILRFDKDILGEAGNDPALLQCAVWRSVDTENRTPATGSSDTAQPPPTFEPSALERDEHQSTSATTEQPIPQPIPQKVPGKTPGSHKKRQRAIVATASAVLVCAFIGIVYSGIRTVVTPEKVAMVEASHQTVAQASTEAAPALPVREKVLATSKSAPAPASIATPTTTAPENTLVISIPPIELVANDITSTPAVAAAEPLSQNRATPQNTNTNRNTAATPAITGSRQTNRNSVNRREVAAAAPALSEAQTEAESRREQEQVQEQQQTALVTYERDLLAAELALVQGRLTHPPESNAHTLYKKLLASNPESAEARRGFQALGAALVNRAFAEVAAKRWSAARATLAAAAEAGASPNLVADLSGEVAYQQRLADAEAGRFAALYPATELVALNRTTPRLRRYTPDGIDSVQIEFTISVSGNVQDIEVLGAPPQRLERVVRQAVTDWRFEPVLSGTRPVPVRTRVGLEIP